MKYETETLLTEDSNEPIKKEKLSSITIYYTYEMNMGFDENGRSIDIPRFDKVNYIIWKNPIAILGFNISVDITVLSCDGIYYY